ncbi:MAG: hypothetical protein FWH02_01095 [Oscillospiraceae bacterium]|nr:hypothetical protein [Oscillospiraceae bacterium]
MKKATNTQALVAAIALNSHLTQFYSKLAKNTFTFILKGAPEHGKSIHTAGQ